MERVGGKQDPPGMIMYRGEFIPDDLIVEILSWLPAKSLLKFKCVCKSWKIIIQDQTFIQKHKIRGKCYDYWCLDKSEPNGNGETFIWKHDSNGLVLENSRKTGLYRIRNPATKQVVEVLDDPEEQLHRRMVMNLDLSTNNCKLLSLIFKKVIIFRKETTDIGFKMLTVGTDHVWRPLDISFLPNENRRHIFWAFSKEIKYVICLCKAQLEKTEIIRFDLEAESFIKVKIPPGFQSCGVDFHTFSCDEKLSLGFIINQQFHMWVLENFEKHTWSKKRIIPLDFMKKYPCMSKNLCVCGAAEGLLLIATSDRNLFQYDIDSKILYRVKAPPCRMVPCLVSLKGMHTEGINPCPVSLQKIKMHSEAAIKPKLLVECIGNIRRLWISRHKYFSCCKPVKKHKYFSCCKPVKKR